MSQAKTEAIPPPPTTGGSHSWDAKAKAWVTTERTIQADDPEHPDNKARVAVEGEPVKET